VAIVFDPMRSIAPNTSRALSSIRESYVFSLLVVLALENTRIHICILNNSNLAFHIKGSVNKHFDR